MPHTCVCCTGMRTPQHGSSIRSEGGRLECSSARSKSWKLPRLLASPPTLQRHPEVMFLLSLICMLLVVCHQHILVLQHNAVLDSCPCMASKEAATSFTPKCCSHAGQPGPVQDISASFTKASCRKSCSGHLSQLHKSILQKVFFCCVAAGAAGYFRQQAAAATHSHWQLIQLAATSTAGIFKVSRHVCE